MLNENAASRDERVALAPVPPQDSPEEQTIIQMRERVGEVLVIETAHFDAGAFLEDDNDILMTMLWAGSEFVAGFNGHLVINSEAAYEQLDQALKPLNMFPIFRQAGGYHVVIVLEGRVSPRPRTWWPNLLLFIATFFSVLLIGHNIALNEIAGLDLAHAEEIAANGWAELWRGWPYATAILLILGAHELGHYFAARRHNLAVTLPYFIPMPFLSLFGTFGAFIQLREPIRNRKVLMDVGAAGPLAGFVFAFPILLIGLSMSQVGPVPEQGLYEGDSILYALAKIITFGEFLPSNGVDVFVGQLAWAGWTGLLVSALNLIPVGQLDGGHILYALLGHHARKLYYPLMATLALLVFVSNVWLMWLLLLMFFGHLYATPLDMITPLDRRRQWVGVAALVLFVLSFVPAPLTQTTNPPPPPNVPYERVQHPPAEGVLAAILPESSSLNDQ